MMKLLRVFSKLFRGQKKEKVNKAVFIDSAGASYKTTEKPETNLSKNQTAISSVDYQDKFKTSDNIEQQKVSEALPTPKKDIESPAIKTKKGTLFIQVGLDFGTSSTKMAYRRLTGDKTAYPILFNHELEHYPSYCLPSVLAFNNSGDLLLGVEAARHLADKPWNEGIRRIKVLLAGKSENRFDDRLTRIAYEEHINKTIGSNNNWDVEHFASLYIVYAISKARQYLQDKYKGHYLDIRYNICIPIDYIQHNNIKVLYEKMFATVSQIEKLWGNNNNLKDLLDRSCNIFADAAYVEDDPETRIFGIPEPVAEVASYLDSLQAKEGKHAIIDFGGGTTDISILDLQIYQKNENMSSWYSAFTFPGGVNIIERVIHRHLQNKADKICSDIMVKEYIHHKLENAPKILKDEIKDELEKIWMDTRKAWQAAYKKEKGQSNWEKDKVQIFTSGGGCKLPYVNDVFKESWHNQGYNDWGPYPICELPSPDCYDSKNPGIPFKRLSVAFGLTVDKLDLGQYTLPRDCPDFTPLPLPVKKGKHNHSWLGSH